MTDTRGHVLHWALGYDLLAWLMMGGNERAFRQRLVELARLEPGQSVLDVGCGTGSLAIAAKGRVGPAGRVHGIDPSAEMVARATKKAAKSGVEVTFAQGVVERLPSPDRQLDVVLSTVMLHHLPDAERVPAVREMRRVLKPGGRLFAVDFGNRPRRRGSFLAHLHLHGRVAMPDVLKLARETGLEIVDSGPVGTWNLEFVLARA